MRYVYKQTEEQTKGKVNFQPLENGRKGMRYRSAFDIIGPIMVGPSSSHTAGAVRIGKIAREIFGEEPERIDVHFYGSFAETYRGHATDVAIISGVMDFATSDPRIPDAIEIARKENIEVNFYVEEAVPESPNTVRIVLYKGETIMDLVGVSIGGGSVQIKELNGFPLKLSGDYPSTLILHRDVFGAIAGIANIFAKHEINICHMEDSRRGKGDIALMVVETDQIVKEEVVEEISKESKIIDVTILS